MASGFADDNSTPETRKPCRRAQGQAQREAGMRLLAVLLVVLAPAVLHAARPAFDCAKAAVLLDSIVGQLYLAFFVSVMIGKYMQAHSATPSDT